MAHLPQQILHARYMVQGLIEEYDVVGIARQGDGIEIGGKVAQPLALTLRSCQPSRFVERAHRAVKSIHLLAHIEGDQSPLQRSAAAADAQPAAKADRI